MSDILDIAKATGGAGTVGVGTWYVEISQLLQLGISIACFVYLVTKVFFLIKNKGK